MQTITGVGGSLSRANPSAVAQIQIPVPPLEVQREIVAEIEGYQRVIDGARAVIDNYRPHIPIDPDWPVVELGEVCEINPETVNPALTYPGKTIFYVDISSIENQSGRFLGYREIPASHAPNRARRSIRSGDVLLSTVRPNLRAFALLESVKSRAIASTGFAVLRPMSWKSGRWFHSQVLIFRLCGSTNGRQNGKGLISEYKSVRRWRN